MTKREALRVIKAHGIDAWIDADDILWASTVQSDGSRRIECPPTDYKGLREWLGY